MTEAPEPMEEMLAHVEAAMGIPLSESQKRVLSVLDEEVKEGKLQFDKTRAEIEKLGADGSVRPLDQLPRLEFPLDPNLGKYWLTNAELTLVIEDYIKRQGLDIAQEAPPRPLDQLPRIKFPIVPAEIAEHKITGPELRLLIENEWRLRGLDPATVVRKMVAAFNPLAETQAPRLLELKMGSGPKRPMPEWYRRIRDGEPYPHRIDPDLFADERSDDEEEEDLSTNAKKE